MMMRKEVVRAEALLNSVPATSEERESAREILLKYGIQERKD
ncbi:MAG: hypothetical protein ABIJ83_04205 [Patescibacteria group bacterium]